MAYVYRHIRNDKNEPFYIGIGSDLTYKRANEKTRRNNIWKSIINKTNYNIEILFDNISINESKLKEIEFIKLYGRIDLGTGSLTNMTSGGDGINDRVFTEEYRRKLSEAAKKRLPQPQLQLIIEYRKTKFKFTKEIREKLSKASKGRKLKESQIIKLKERVGEKNPMFGIKGKLNSNYLGDIIAFKNGIKFGQYEGVHDCARELNISATKISACLNGRRNMTGGYTFLRINKIS